MKMKKLWVLLIYTLFLHANMLPQNVLGKNCLKYYHSYEGQSEHNAFVYAREKETGKDRCNWAYGYATVEEAIDSAMKNCQSFTLNAECKLLYTDGVFNVEDGAFTSLTPVDATPLSKEEISSRMEEAKAVILGNCLPFFEKFLHVDEHKSFAYSVDANRHYACGYSYRNQTEKTSKKQAIKSCNDNKVKRGNKAPISECKVYATNKKILLIAKDYDLKPLPKAIKLTPEAYDKKLKQANMFIKNWPCRIQYKYYLKSKPHNAFYLIEDKNGQQMCGRSEGRFTSDSAKEKAKEHCEQQAQVNHINGVCQLLSSDLVFLGKKEMFKTAKKVEVIHHNTPEVKKKNKTQMMKKESVTNDNMIDMSKPLPLYRTLQVTAETLNKDLPMKIDDELRFDSVDAEKNKMTFNYTLVHLTNKEISAEKFKSLIYENIKSQACVEKDFQILLKKGMFLDYYYVGKDKKEIARFAFEAKTCGLLTNVEQIRKNILNLIKKK